MNDKNLKRGNPETQFSGRFAVESAEKSHTARRRNRDLKRAILDVLASDIENPDIYNLTAQIKGETNDMDYLKAVVSSMVREACLGNVKAFEALMKYTNITKAEAERLKLEKQKLKLAEERLGAPEEAAADDGFLAALEGTAEEDWSGDEDDKNDENGEDGSV